MIIASIRILQTYMYMCRYAYDACCIKFLPQLSSRNSTFLHKIGLHSFYISSFASFRFKTIHQYIRKQYYREMVYTMQRKFLDFCNVKWITLTVIEFPINIEQFDILFQSLDENKKKIEYILTHMMTRTCAVHVHNMV